MPQNKSQKGDRPITPEAQATKRDWVGIIGVAITMLVCVVASTVYLTHRFEEVEQRMTKAEGALKVLGSEQSDKTRDLIKELLSEATERARGNQPEIAARAAKTATVLVAAQRRDKNEAPPQFFEAAAKQFSEFTEVANADLIEAGYGGLSALAEYKSVLRKPIAAPPAFTVQTGNTGPYILKGPSLGHVSVSRSVFRNGRQKLDNFFWDDVIFENMDIEFEGGETQLRNVTFVNCRFRIKSVPAARSIMLYAINGHSRFEGGDS